jgi:hypothetical protein
MYEFLFLQTHAMAARYIVFLLSGQFRVRTPVGARFSEPIQTSPETHPSSCIMDIMALSWG